MDNKCIFNCIIENCNSKAQADKFLTIKNKEKIVQSSVSRKDGKFLDLSDTSNLYSHANCLATYTSKLHISRYLKKRKSTDEPECSRRKSLRIDPDSQLFDFEHNCLFCGEACHVKKAPDKKNPGRWRRGVLCETAERGKYIDGIPRKDFKTVVLDVST